MLLRALILLLPVALATGGHGGGDHGGGPRPGGGGGGKDRECPTKTVEVCAEDMKWGEPEWITKFLPDKGAHCTGTTITEGKLLHNAHGADATVTPTSWVPCETPTKTKESCVATQVLCEPHPKRAVPDAMSNAERLRRGLPLRAPLQARGEHEHPHGGPPGQRGRDRDGHPHGGPPGREGKQRGGQKHGGWGASCTPTTVTVTTSTSTRTKPTCNTLTRTESSCEGGPTHTAPGCKTKTVDGKPVTKTRDCKRGAGFTAWVTHEFTATATEYGARCTPRVDRQ